MMGLTDAQMDAIQQFAHRSGRNWKSHLRDAWMTGNYYNNTSEYAGELQTIRNEKGPSWLVKFRLPKFCEVPR